MELYLRRKIFTKVSTISTLHAGHPESSLICYTIEDADRGLEQSMTLEEIKKLKKYAVTAIPYGRYKVVITKSPRFTAQKGRDIFTPQLLNVPGFEGIRIHPANLASELEGCIAPGMSKKIDRIVSSVDAYGIVLDKISLAIRAGEEVYITIQKDTNL